MKKEKVATTSGGCKAGVTVALTIRKRSEREPKVKKYIWCGGSNCS